MDAGLQSMHCETCGKAISNGEYHCDSCLLEDAIKAEAAEEPKVIGYHLNGDEIYNSTY